MNVLFHYAAGPDLTARLAAVPGLTISVCPDDDDALLFRLLPETDVLWHVLKPCTAAMIASAAFSGSPGCLPSIDASRRANRPLVGS